LECYRLDWNSRKAGKGRIRWPSAAAKITVDGHVARQKPPRHAHPIGNLGEVEPAAEAAPERTLTPNRPEKYCCHGRLDSNSVAVRQFPQFDNDDFRRLADRRPERPSPPETVAAVLDDVVPGIPLSIG